MKIDWIIRTVLFSIFLFILGTINAHNVFGFDQPVFPSCLNPQGKLIAQYSSGTHGVPGMNQTFTGSDSVYTLSSSSVIQCLCPENGQGIQTNWMKASDLSQAEISILEKQGWVYITNGLVWGLDDGPYMAQNTNFSCPSSSDPGKITQQVLGLATTGNIILLYCFLTGGTFFVGLGLLIRNKK